MRRAATSRKRRCRRSLDATHQELSVLGAEFNAISASSATRWRPGSSSSFRKPRRCAGTSRYGERERDALAATAKQTGEARRCRFPRELARRAAVEQELIGRPRASGAVRAGGARANCLTGRAASGALRGSAHDARAIRCRSTPSCSDWIGFGLAGSPGAWRVAPDAGCSNRHSVMRRQVCARPAGGVAAASCAMIVISGWCTGIGAAVRCHRAALVDDSPHPVKWGLPRPDVASDHPGDRGQRSVWLSAGPGPSSRSA